MKQRGRKSAASLSIVPIFAASRRPAPPADLTAAQAKTWREIVASTPGGWFSVAQEPLLSAYCRHVSAAGYLSDIINKSKIEDDLDRYGKLLAMRCRETMAISSLATRMRLTQQAQMHPRTAGRAVAGAPVGQRPWDN